MGLKNDVNMIPRAWARSREERLYTEKMVFSS